MQEILSGAGTKVFFGILHPDLINQDPVPLPPDVVATLSAAASAGAVSLSVTALLNPLPAGSALQFYPPSGTSPVVLSAQATKGASTLAVDELTEAIAPGAKIKFPGYEFDVSVTAAVSVGATSIPVRTLKQSIAEDSAGYVFFGPYQTAYTSDGTSATKTSISILPLNEAIASGSVALHRGLLLLQGGTDAKEDVSTDEETNPMFGDEGGYENGTATSAKWSVSYDAMVLSSEPGYYRLSYAARNASRGVYGYVVKRDAAPAGFIYGEQFEGICQAIGISKKNPAKGSVTFSTSFNGRGEPISTPPRK